MKYFKIWNALNKIGSYPQIRIDSVSLENKSNEIKMISIEGFYPITIYNWKFYNKKSKFTDLLSKAAMPGILGISDKLKTLFENNIIEKDFQFINSILTDFENNNKEVWLIIPQKNHYQCLDFMDTIFEYIDPINPNNRKRIYPKNKLELINLLESSEKYYGSVSEASRLYISQIKFAHQPEGSAPQLIYLSPLYNGGAGYFVSAKLKTEIENAGCTGIVFTEPNEKYP